MAGVSTWMVGVITRRPIKTSPLPDKRVCLLCSPSPDKRKLFDWTTGGEQTPFPANKHHSYARVPFIIIFMTFCAFEGMDGVNTNEVCTDLLNVLQKKRLVTQAQHDCFQWGGDFASKLNLPRRRDALLSDDEKHGGSESRESRRFF